MNAVHLIVHRNKPEIKTLTRQIVASFQCAGIAVSCEDWLLAQMGEEGNTLFRQGEAHYDAVISVGGDGTLLQANRLAIQKDVPLLGINQGRIGFLAEVELEQLSQACEKLKNDDYRIERRMLLETACEGHDTLLALNDIVVSRGGYSRLIAVNAWVGREFVGRYIADGLIVSTPTGSTAYSLSAGGPIVFPGVDCIVLSPICAHSLQHRPVVISSQQTVTLELDCEPEQRAQLSADGQETLFVSPQQKLRINRSSKQAQFIRFHSRDFFTVIRQKLSEWSC